MKKTMISTISLFGALFLASCSESTAEPEAYGSIDEWQADIAESSLNCDWRETGALANSVECVEEEGGTVILVVHANGSARDDRVEQYRRSDSWQELRPAIVSAQNWTAECASTAQCERWADETGGDLLLAPNY